MKIIPLQSGIALVQVLLLTAILSVLVLYFTQTSRQQVALANLANQRTEALINMQSAKNRLLFKLLTEQKSSKNQQVKDGAATINWNFFGQTFDVSDGVTASLQDQSGLLSAHFVNGELLQKMLIQNGVDSTQAYNIFHYLLDWQDIDNLAPNFNAESNTLGDRIRNGHIPDLTDLAHIPAITPEVYQLLKQTMTIYYAGRFNPMTAPEPLLSALISPEALMQVMEMRSHGQLTKNQFSVVSGINEDEDIWFTPSDFLQFVITSNVGEVSLTKRWMISLNPYTTTSQPVNYITIRG